MSFIVRRQTTVSPVKIENKPLLSIHDAIKPIYYIAFPMCLWSYRYSENNKITPLTTPYKVYIYGSTILMILYYCLITCKDTLATLTEHFSATVITDAAYSLSIFITGVTSIFLAQIKNNKLQLKFVLLSENISKEMLPSSNKIHNKLRKTFTITCVLLVFSSICLTIMDTTIKLITVGVESVTMHAAELILENQLGVICMMIHFKTEILLQYFKHVNKELENCLSFKKMEISRIYDKPLSEFNLIQVKKWCRLHGKLCNSLKIVNEMHGWELVMITITTVTLLLNYLYAGTTVINQNKSGDTDMLTTIYMWKILCISFGCMIMVMLATKCAFTTAEIHKSGHIASDALWELEVNDTISNKNSYKETLQLLVDQISFKRPHFSAAGMFAIDLTTISTITGAVLSYFIVFLQFRDTGDTNCVALNSTKH